MKVIQDDIDRKHQKIPTHNGLQEESFVGQFSEAQSKGLKSLPQHKEVAKESCSLKGMWTVFLRKIGTAMYIRRRSYYWLHLAFWAFMCLIMSAFVYASGRKKDLSYIDSLYYAASATSATGLMSTDFSKEGGGTQILVFLMMLVSGAVFESMIPIMLRIWRLKQTGESYTVSIKQSEVYIILGVITFYWFILQLFGFLILGFYIQFSEAGSTVMETNNVNAWWWSIFQTVSSFNNCGFSLLSDSLVQFNTQIFVLIFCGGLILLGNTAYPVFLRATLRLIDTIFYQRFPSLSKSCRLILDHPRSYTTHLFPSHSTWALVVVLFLVNGLQSILMISHNQNVPAFDNLSAGYMEVNAIFQSISVRTAGLNSINISQLNIESLVLMIMLMYVSAYPITIKLRSTNTSVEKSRYHKTAVDQLRRLLMQDVMWICAPWYLICAIEGYDTSSEGFIVLFEVVSAYGTVGLSLGLSCCSYSFSGSWSVPSKLIIILVMLFGRHRGMPDNLDSAILLDFNRDFAEITSRS